MDPILGSVDSEMSSDIGQTASEQALNPDLLLGLPEIDSQHRALFAQLDRLIGKPQAHPVAEPFSEILSQLGRQIDAHFLSEESILQACDMPPEELAEHMSAHEEILEQYTRLNLDLMAGKAVGQQTILRMVRGWIVDHVLQYDSRIRQYVSLSQEQ